MPHSALPPGPSDSGKIDYWGHETHKDHHMDKGGVGERSSAATLTHMAISAFESSDFGNQLPSSQKGTSGTKRNVVKICFVH